MLRSSYPFASVATLLFQQGVVRSASYGIVCAALLTRLFYGVFDYEPSTPIFLLLFLFIASLTGLAITWSKRAEFLHGTLLTVQPILDVIVVSLVVYFSGGIESRLVFLYVVPALASIIVSTRFAVLVGIGVVSAFAVVGLGEYYGIFPIIEKVGYGPQELLIARILRVALLEVILVGGTLFYIKFLLTRGQEALMLRDEGLYSMSQVLRQPLEDAQRFLSSVREQKLETGFNPQTIEDLEVEIKSSLTMCDNIIGNMERNETPGEDESTVPTAGEVAEEPTPLR